MDELEAYFGEDKLLERAIEHALLELAAKRVRAEIWEGGEVGLLLGLDLVPSEGGLSNTADLNQAKANQTQDRLH
jgi:hypothetical protein